VGEAVYAIDDFPDDDLLWQIEWIGGVGYNTIKATETAITILGMRGLKNQTIPARLPPILQ
jgi:hypothetical protein